MKLAIAVVLTFLASYVLGSVYLICHAWGWV